MRNDAKISWFTITFSVFAGVLMWSIAQAFITLDIRWLALSWGCVGGVAMIYDRKIQHDKLCEPIPVIRPAVEQKTAVVTAEKEYVPTVHSHNGQRVKYGKFRKTSAEWQKLANAILSNNNRVVRDVVSMAGVFESITRKWSHIYAEFERMGWAKDNALTDDGVTFFEAWQRGEVPPAPPHLQN